MAIITHLVVDEVGAFVSKHQGRLWVKKGKEVLQQAPLMHLQQVIITGKGVSLSSDVIQSCAELGIPLHFVDFRGTPYANLYASGLTETVQTRRAQLKAFDDDRGVTLSIAFATAKIKNQTALLRYMGKYRKETNPELFEELRLLALEVQDHLEPLQQLARRGNTIADIRAELMGAEGRAAQKYWAGIKLAVSGLQDWSGRKGRGATDAFNSALNYGYGILYGQIERAIVLAGLEPFAGFIHVDRPGKPSLTLDLIEEFRQPVVDRTIAAMFNQKVDIDVNDNHLLTDNSRKAIVARVLERLEKTEKYEGKRVPLRIIIQNQARHLATFVRRDRAEYTGFSVKW